MKTIVFSFLILIFLFSSCSQNNQETTSSGSMPSFDHSKVRIVVQAKRIRTEQDSIMFAERLYLFTNNTDNAINHIEADESVTEKNTNRKFEDNLIQFDKPLLHKGDTASQWQGVWRYKSEVNKYPNDSLSFALPFEQELYTISNVKVNGE